MIRWIAAAVAVASSPPPCPLSASGLQPATGDLVELDVVALDRNDQPVTDLRQDEFTVKEDGRLVELKTFTAVTALGSTQPDDGRVVVLLMDDIGVPISGTSPMQQIAPVVLSPLGDGDEVSVVRLSSRSDEAFGDVGTARDRIDGYRGGAVPFSLPRHAGDRVESDREDLAPARVDRSPAEGDSVPRPAVGLRRRASRRWAAPA